MATLFTIYDDLYHPELDYRYVSALSDEPGADELNDYPVSLSYWYREMLMSASDYRPGTLKVDTAGQVYYEDPYYAWWENITDLRKFIDVTYKRGRCQNGGDPVQDVWILETD